MRTLHPSIWSPSFTIMTSSIFAHRGRGACVTALPACATASQVQDVATAIGALVLKLRKINVPPEFTATSSELPASMTTSAWGTTSCRCVHSSSAPTSRFIAPLSSVELRRLDGRRAAAEAIDAAGSLLATNPPSWTCTAWQVVSPVPEWFGFDTAGGISAPAPISASREAATPAEPSRAEWWMAATSDSCTLQLPLALLEVSPQFQTMEVGVLLVQ
mmetsp:Transcript_12230/g.30917  ORF Transcript_12230/g.30917 Transcript_12230/m.30917 type:complete len:217 (+) Transcript_12230:22-672(+)